MIVDRLLNLSKKDKAITSFLVLSVVFNILCLSMMFVALDAQIVSENELKRDTRYFVDFYQCLYNADGLEIEGKLYVNGDDYKACVETLLENRPKFMEFK